MGEKQVRTCKKHGEMVHYWLVTKKTGRGRWRCRRCEGEAVLKRKQRVRRVLILEAGDCCQCCGYDRCRSNLHFHHVDRSGATTARRAWREKLAGPGVVLVGTIRRDGSPRISPVEPLLWNGDLWLAMGLGTLKARDLERDPRILVHSIITKRDGSDGEHKVRGRAEPVIDAQAQEDFAGQVRERLGWNAKVGNFHLFPIEIDDITFIRRTAASTYAVGRRRRARDRRSRSATCSSESPDDHRLVTPGSQPRNPTASFAAQPCSEQGRDDRSGCQAAEEEVELGEE